MEMVPMIPQTGHLFELFILTHIALEFVLASMDVGMLPQEVLLGEVHPANATCVKLDRSTDQRMVGMFLSLMDGQFDLLIENLLTNNALLLSIRTVDCHVLK